MSRHPILLAAVASLFATIFAAGHSRAGPALGPPVDGALRGLAVDVLQRGGGPGGGDVADLEVIQVEYELMQGTIILAWTENTFNASGVEITIQGSTLGTIDGLDQDKLPGINSVRIEDVPLGNRIFGIRAGGTELGNAQEVIAEPPFADVRDLACASAGHDDDGKCQLEATWTNPGPLPDIYYVYLNGEDEIEIAGDLMSATRVVEGEGDHTVMVWGFSEEANGNYAGRTRVTTTCSVACAAPCDPPYGLLLCQCEHGAGATNSILATWSNGEEPYPVSVIEVTDGTEIGTVPGDSLETRVGGLVPGEHVIGVRGDCGAAGKSIVTDAAFTALVETPFTSPIVGDLHGSFDPATSKGVIAWTKDETTLFIDVIVESGLDTYSLGRFSGELNSLTIENAFPTDRVILQFFGRADGACHGSTLRSCRLDSLELFLRADVDSSGEIDLTDPIFILTFLFLGHVGPACPDAADADDSGNIDISDAILILTWKFLGGRPPAEPLDCGADVEPDDLAACAPQC